MRAAERGPQSSRCCLNMAVLAGSEFRPGPALEFCHQRKVDSQHAALSMAFHLPRTVLTWSPVSMFYIPGRSLTYMRRWKEIKRVLSPGGHLLLRLPAYDWLRGRHDEAVHTARRFTVKGIKDLLHSTGFTVLHSSYANTILFPFALGKARQSMPGQGAPAHLTLPSGSDYSIDSSACS